MDSYSLYSVVSNPSVPSSRTPDDIAFQVHNAVDRFVTREPSWPFNVRYTVFRPKYGRSLVAIFIIAVEGGVQRGREGAGGIFDVSLGEVLRRLWGRMSGL